MSSTQATSTTESITNTVSAGVDYVKNSAQELMHGTAKEAKKEEAKDSENSLTDRASAALDAGSHKIQETTHGLAADGKKEEMKH